MVIGGQVMNGLGIGCAFLTNPLLQEIVPKSHRPIAVGFSTLASAGSFIGAPIIEGVFIQQAIGGALEGWRVGFYVGAGIFCISFITLYFFYTPMPRPNVHGLNVIQRLLKLDWIGIFLGCFGLTLFLVGINYGGNPYEWTSGIVLGTLITGLGLLVSFGLWEWRGTSTGVLPHAVFQDRNYNTSLIIRVSGGFALYGCQAYLPQMAVYVFGTDGLTTAVWQLPLNISSISGAVLAAVILCFYKEARWISAGLLLVLAFGGGLMILVKPGINMALWIVPSILMGLAIGAEAALITIICGLTSPNELIGTAVCIGTAAGFIGASIATTMYGQISNAKVKQLLIPAISKAAVTAGLPESSLTDFLTAFSYQSADAIAAVPGATAEVVKAVTRASRLAYAEAYTYIWYTLIAFAVTSTLGCFLFTRTTHYFTNEVAAPVQERRVLAPHNRQSQAGGVVAGGEHGIERRVSS
ncbi:fungal trichothecene efflux pump-domain-containing protein [Dactylonectria macrodidyma]|uniref:Fungal trichothecene efflux pump-domain-containing protein n=1 Tax=Dactylonectria macrodidyma TaxID=307937 RepID=A0A9P9EBF4_9HYPO|nr:fungal trichothecene efflux pump-domain-containing protein [Dactylonectria macrodidyma]